MRKAKKNVAQSDPQPRRKLALWDIRLQVPKDDVEEFWSGTDFHNLAEFIKTPNLDNAHTAASLAFQRIEGILSLIPSDESALEKREWQGIASCIELNASIMRRAFELASDKAVSQITRIKGS